MQLSEEWEDKVRVRTGYIKAVSKNFAYISIRGNCMQAHIFGREFLTSWKNLVQVILSVVTFTRRLSLLPETDISYFSFIDNYGNSITFQNPIFSMELPCIN